MARAKQSRADRERRLNEGRCPVHGIWMPQFSSWYLPCGHSEPGFLTGDEDAAYTIVSCPRADCGIMVKAFDVFGPWKLTKEWSWILDVP